MALSNESERNRAVTRDQALEHRGTKGQVSHLHHGDPGRSLRQDIRHVGLPPTMGGVGDHPEPQIRGEGKGVAQRVHEADVGELGPGRFEGQADAGGVSDRGHRGDGPREPLDGQLVRPPARRTPAGLHGGGAEALRRLDSQDQGVAGA